MNSNDNRQLTVTPRDQQQTKLASDRDKAAAIMRDQIDRLYDGPQPQTVTQTPVADDNPYEQTHDAGHEATATQWQHYHSAWQQYYQQYYERYYLAEHTKLAQTQIAQAPLARSTQSATAPEIMTEEKAVDEIRSDLRSKIEHHAKNVRKSRHFIPVISALVVMSLFLFLQYNRLFIGQLKSWVSPGSIAAQNIIIDPTTSTVVGPEPKIVIPKINVDAPVVYDVPSLAEATVQNALRSGVIHYPIPGASSNPGEKGNAVFLGHSSNDVFDDGNYKFIFVQLEQLAKGDTFYLNYNKVRYTYTVTSTETILPNQVSKLVLPADKPTATLVTCTPVGTAQKRFVVYADQISPDPNAAASVAQSEPTSQPSAITGNSPTLFDRLFGF